MVEASVFERACVVLPAAHCCILAGSRHANNASRVLAGMAFLLKPAHLRDQYC